MINQKLENAALSLLLRVGIKRLRVEHICQQAGVSKVSFYKLYPDKFTILAIVLDRFYESSFQDMMKILKAELLPTEVIANLIDHKINLMKSCSDFFIQDLFQTDHPQIGDIIKKWSQKTEKSLLGFFASLRKLKKVDRRYSNQTILLLMHDLETAFQSELWREQFKDDRKRMEFLVHYFFYGLIGGPS